MISELDWNQDYFVIRSRGRKKQSIGGRKLSERDPRRIAKLFIRWTKIYIFINWVG